MGKGKTLGKRAHKYNKREKRRMAGQSFALKKPIRDTEFHTKIVYDIDFASVAASPGTSPARYVITPDGYQANSVSTTNYSSAQFNKLAGVYSEYMVSFYKVEYIPYIYNAAGA